MGVDPKIVGILPPKWMVKISWFQPYEHMDDLGGKNPLFLVQHQGKPWNYNLFLVFIMEIPIKLHGIVMENPIFGWKHPCLPFPFVTTPNPPFQRSVPLRVPPRSPFRGSHPRWKPCRCTTNAGGWGDFGGQGVPAAKVYRHFFSPKCVQ